MSSNARKAGFTYVELIVVVIIICVALAVLVPYIQAAREKARRNTCINNMKELGLAFHNYHDLYKHFPGSADLIGSGPVKQAGGWSFFVHLLPMMDQDKLYKTLPANTVYDPINSMDKNVIAARNTLIPELICPSNPNKHYQDSWKGLNAFTNYKGMGATSAESLICCADPNASHPYGYGSYPLHPDGALFPGKGLKLSDFGDGTAHTILAVETIDDSSSVWLAGSDVTLVGMPKVAMTPPALPGTNDFPFWRPNGFNGQYGDDASPAIKVLRTYLSYDFTPGGKDAGSYPASVGRTPKYGPSSGHPAIVNHLFGDGGVKSITSDVDFAMYFFAITRNNGDPAPCN